MIKIGFIKIEKCKNCDGSGKKTGAICEICKDNGWISLGEVSAEEVAKMIYNRLPDEAANNYSEEELNKVKEIFESARNKNKDT